MIALLSALGTALILIAIDTLLAKHFSSKLIAAAILCSIAFIYVGFSLKGNAVHSIVLEVLVAVGFFFIAAIGHAWNNALIAYGIIIHGIWDVLHHKAVLIATAIPGYYPLYCLTVDVILGAYFLFVFRRKQKLGSISN